MKRLLFSMAICLTLFACSSDDDLNPKTESTTVQSIWNTLNGTYKGVFYLMGNSDKIWYTETICFHPYEKTKEIFSFLEGNFIAYGTADILDSRIENISGVEHFYYSINKKYEGATPTISFYKMSDDGSVINREDRRNIKNWSTSSFKMWSYGLTENENSVIYTKQ